jgi:hypothetical protein
MIGFPVAFIMDKGNGIQCIQKLNGSVLDWFIDHHPPVEEPPTPMVG